MLARRVTASLRVALTAAIVAFCCSAPAAEHPQAKNLLWLIGSPDAFTWEFGLAEEGYQAFARRYGNPIVYTVGSSKSSDWPYIHPSHRDGWAGAKAYTFTVRFQSPQDQNRPLFLLIGIVGAHNSEHSKITVTVGKKALPIQIAPAGDGAPCFNRRLKGTPRTIIFPIPAGLVKKGANSISIRLDEQSWILYDYVALSKKDKPLAIVPPPEVELLAEFRKGPMAGVEEIVFAVRKPGRDGHWYANFSYYADDENRLTYAGGGGLFRFDLTTGKTTAILEDPEGTVRDPVVHYDGRKILFSYRKGGTSHCHLHEVNIYGSGLRRLTDGPYDDIEPIYLPDGHIMFVSSRCKRWVNCWLTKVAVLYRCDADGRNIRILSSNNEHDNTPWVLPGGQVLYTRWEYVDRSQVLFHHLWISSPDGIRQTVFYGNMHPSTVMIDAKPIPGSRKVVVSFSPGHGRRDHDGVITIVDPRNGPDDKSFARQISRSAVHRDPWAFSEEAFMTASGQRILLMDGRGLTQTVFELSEKDRKAGLQCHEPRPLCRRPREPVVPNKVDWTKETGRLLLTDVNEGRSMEGVKPKEIKKLLVLETLPKPINFTGGMEPISYGGTFTLERVLGTIPIEADGSAYAELPTLRSLFFVALNENDMAVKRMQSFVTVMPGETTTCVGCHEQRTTTPLVDQSDLLACRRKPSRIEPIADVPEVFDFPRDIQPILDRHCVECHDYDKPEGGVILTGDRGPMFSISYYTITARSMVSDGRNALGNRAPRTIGSSASRLMKLIDGSHYDAKLSEHERKMVRLWIETGAAYPGTYAALGSGMIGGYAQNQIDRSDIQWPSMKASMEAIKRRCRGCHKQQTALPLSPTDNVGGPPWVTLKPDDHRRRFTRHLLSNLTRPERSLILLAPLSKKSGGHESCGQAVFADTADADYQKVLLAVQDTKKKLDRIKRFDMLGFRPRPQYVREMKHYGIIPADLAEDAPIDCYAVEKAYWESLWHRADNSSGSRQ